uniref:CheR family methyltransferase n=3 Tax=Neokomagataea TaxID=1223423 RepID=UPI0023EEAE1F
MNNIDINYIKQTINKKYGLSFSEEKDDFLRNSIKKFFHGSGFNDVNKYVDYSILLNDDQKIIDKLTTNFTLFYREEHHFIYLINALKRVKEKIKIWSAGCSTGEEVYSIAISIHDLCRVNNIKYKILGSDINCRVVNLAKKNQYTYDDIKNIYKKYNKFII